MKKLELIDKFMIAALILFTFMLCGSLSAQERYSVEKIDYAYIINFEDKWIDYSWDANGNPIKSYGRLVLEKKEYKQLIKDIKRLLNQTEADIDRSGYSILKWSWDKDTVWVYKGKKGFGLAKLDIELLNSKL